MSLVSRHYTFENPSTQQRRIILHRHHLLSSAHRRCPRSIQKDLQFLRSPSLSGLTPDTTPNSVPIITPVPNPNKTPEPVPIIATNPDPNTTPTELKSPKQEGDDELNTENMKPTRTSDVWDHFTKIPKGNPLHPRCTCNYCGADYACHSRRVGTSSLWAHLDKCKKNLNKVTDKKQKILSFQPGGDKTGNLLVVTFNKVICRNALAKFVVKDEQAFNVVEGVGFRELMQELQPNFVVTGRNTLTRDIYHLFCNERTKLKKELTKPGQRICLTTDCWMARTQISYMFLTAHYINSDWKLQKRILNFCQVANHKAETIRKVIEACLLDWGVEKVFTVTVDNATANDGAVGFVKRRVNAWKGSVLDGEFMHVRCGAHILNLIVNDGLKELHDSIAAIRNSVRYIRSSPVRLLKFKGCAEREKIDYKGGLVLDVTMRWNSTYMMLDVALKFEKAFVRYEEDDDKFLSFFIEKENGKKKIGPPNCSDWECSSVFIKFLSTF
ncbi:hypothetical protein AgCh_020640 [Apium graveolens]